NDIIPAINCYDQAIDAAQKSGFTQEIALIYELTGKFWLMQGNRHHAKGFLLDAYHYYSKWGAKRKADLLNNQHADLLQQLDLNPMQVNHFPVNSTSSMSAEQLALVDLASLLRVSRTISSEIDLAKLLESIMKIVVQRAGAQIGTLLLMDSD